MVDLLTNDVPPPKPKARCDYCGFPMDTPERAHNFIHQQGEALIEHRKVIKRLEDRIIAKWPDGYPWIVRTPGGECWGPFRSNADAVAWTELAKIMDCDYEDVMPPPHAKGKE